MKQTREQVLAHIEKTQRKNNFKKYDTAYGLLCTYTTKGGVTRAVFMCSELDRETFKAFCIIKNNLGALRMTVYCEYAYYLDMSPLMQVVINRDE